MTASNTPENGFPQTGTSHDRREGKAEEMYDKHGCSLAARHENQQGLLPPRSLQTSLLPSQPVQA